MNKVMIVDASESDRRLMSGLLVKHSYEPIAVDNMEAAKEEVALRLAVLQHEPCRRPFPVRDEAAGHRH